jgi:tetratricopeptide (TPR) repeat protein
MEKGNYEDALKMLDEAAKGFESCRNYLKSISADKDKEEREYIENEMNVKFASIHILKAISHYALKNKEEALNEYKKAKNFSPSYVEIACNEEPFSEDSKKSYNYLIEIKKLTGE